MSVVAALRERAKDALEAAASSPEAARCAPRRPKTLAFLPPAPATPYRAKLATDKEVGRTARRFSSLKTPDAVRDNRALVNSALTDPDSGVRAAAVEALGLDWTTRPSSLSFRTHWPARRPIRRPMSRSP